MQVHLIALQLGLILLEQIRMDKHGKIEKLQKLNLQHVQFRQGDASQLREIGVVVEQVVVILGCHHKTSDNHAMSIQLSKNQAVVFNQSIDVNQHNDQARITALGMLENALDVELNADIGLIR